MENERKPASRKTEAGRRAAAKELSADIREPMNFGASRRSRVIPDSVHASIRIITAGIMFCAPFTALFINSARVERFSRRYSTNAQISPASAPRIKESEESVLPMASDMDRSSLPQYPPL